jgi:hypothetical protein
MPMRASYGAPAGWRLLFSKSSVRLPGDESATISSTRCTTSTMTNRAGSDRLERLAQYLLIQCD